MDNRIKQISFSETELLSGFTHTGNKIKLINKSVEIILIIEEDTQISLAAFNKAKTEKRKGIVRCALYFLLDKLLKESIIKSDQIVHVSSPTPANGNIERLIGIYTDMGFIIGEPQLGMPINLNATVSNLLETLSKQCSNSLSGGSKKYKRKSRKVYKSRRSKSYRPRVYRK